MRRSGILCPILSLASKGGIGCFSKEALEFIDFLSEAGQSLWQVLPMGPTGFGDSPFQSFSTFAGNPYFISPEELEKEGLLCAGDYAFVDFGQDPERVDYEKVYANRYPMLRRAYANFKAGGEAFAGQQAAFEKFKKDNRAWLEDYVLYTAIKNDQGGISWQDWQGSLSDYHSAEVQTMRTKLKDEMDFWAFLQYEFMKQWQVIHDYASQKKIQIIGDIPFYVSADSADVWASPELFQMDENNRPLAIAGCPPDNFCEDGQLWGNPLYNWEKQKKTGYAWWISRLKRCFELFDVVRIDHFRGFDEYFSIPYGDENARDGKWLPGPGMDFFRALREELGRDVNIIAEDLGLITPTVRKLLKDSGFPGMKVLQFAFDGNPENDYLPYNLTRNSVVYTGTHDNETTFGWIEHISDDTREQARHVIHSVFTNYGAFTWDMIRTAQATVCDTCIIPIQDYLVKDDSARMNAPSTTGGNWQWRMKPHEISPELTESIRDMTETFGRCEIRPEKRRPLWP